MKILTDEKFTDVCPVEKKIVLKPTCPMQMPDAMLPDAM